MKRILIAIALSACMASAVSAQDAPAMPQMTPELQAKMAAWIAASTPGAQHKQLADHFTGNWTARTTLWMDPSMPPTTVDGTSVATVEFGGRHVRSKYSGTMMGQPFTGEAITSYDNTSGKFVNSWFDSMGTGQYVTHGDYDPATQTYTFTGAMSDPTKDDKVTEMKDTIRFTDSDHYVMESFELVDGKEVKMMQIEYARAAD